MLKYKNCIGITESLWQVVTINIDAIVNKCWQVLPVLVLVKLLYDFIINSGTEQITIKDHIRTILRTILIAFFLAFYKDFLMMIDNAIGIFSNLEVDYKEALNILENKKLEALKNMSTARKIAQYPFLILSKLVGTVSYGFSFLTHQGSIIFMDSLKSIILVILSHFGPIAAVISILPGSFSNSFNSWLRNYVNIFAWTITLSILQKLVNLINETFIIGNNLFIAPVSIALLIVILLTPLWTAMFLGNSISSGIMSVIGWSTNVLAGFTKQSTKLGGYMINKYVKRKTE
jgi:hypothetical protein